MHQRKLCFYDIENHSHYEGKSLGLDAGFGLKSIDFKGISPHHSLGYGQDGDHQNSLTRSGIATKNINSDAPNKQAVQTDTTTENATARSGRLNNDFDLNALQSELDLQRTVSQNFSQNTQQINTQINTKVKEHSDRAKDLEKKALDAANRGEPELANQYVSEAQKERQTAENWQRTGVGINMIASGLRAPTNNANGVVVATLSPAVAYKIGQYFKDLAKNNPNGKLTGTQQVAHVFAHTILGMLVSATGGNDPLMGGIAAGGAEYFAPKVSKFLYGTDDPEKLTAEQKDTVANIMSWAGVGVGAAVGGDSANAVQGGLNAESAVENNLLSLQKQERLNVLTAKGTPKSWYDRGSLTEDEASELLSLIKEDAETDQLLLRYNTNRQSLTQAELVKLANAINQYAGNDAQLAQSLLEQGIRHFIKQDRTEAINTAKRVLSYAHSPEHRIAIGVRDGLPVFAGASGAFGKAVRGTMLASGSMLVGSGVNDMRNGQIAEGAVKVGNGMLFIASGITKPSGVGGKVVQGSGNHVPPSPSDIPAILQFKNSNINIADVKYLLENGKKFNPSALVATTRDASGKVVFLEKGNIRAGLIHVENHAKEFLSIGVQKSEIPGFLMKAIKEGKIIGYQGKGTGRPIYQTTYKGKNVKVAITIGNNGYIVGANPKGSVK